MGKCSRDSESSSKNVKAWEEKNIFIDKYNSNN